MSKKNKNKSSKNNYRRNGKGWKQQTSHISKGVIGAYDKFGIILQYKEDTIPFSASPAPAAQVYRANSCFDPNLTGTGHQPDFFDQYSAFYGEYLVTHCEAELTIVNNSSTVSANYVVSFSDQNDSSKSVEALAEDKYSISGAVGPSTGLGVKKLRLPIMPMTRLMGQRGLNSDPFQYAPISASPTDVGYLIFKASAADGVSNINVYVNFRIRFTVIFKELVSPAES